MISQFLKNNLNDALGIKSRRKIIVIESDDWGTIRMPSCQVYKWLEKKGLTINDHYNQHDSLATESDIANLLEVLYHFCDSNGTRAILTVNCLLANPDFKKIRESGFQNYFYEPFTETLKRYPGCSGSFSLWQEGIAKGLFRPQFHGREHLNVSSWLRALRDGDVDATFGFECGFWGHMVREPRVGRMHFLAAYDFHTAAEELYASQVAIDGLSMFEKTFGYSSKSFIAPNFVWSHRIEQLLAERGVVLVQGQRNQLCPVLEAPKYNVRFHFTGQRNMWGMRYLVRNAFFEPSSNPERDWVDSCLRDISRAFFWRTPAIISAHRVNFIGALVPKNRDRNLVALGQLLKRILCYWPDVEFFSTDGLLNLY